MLGHDAGPSLRAQEGRRVTLLEAPQLGGLADAWNLGDVTWDRHYHVILPSDNHTRGLLAEVDLDDQLKWVQTKTGFPGRRKVPLDVEFVGVPAISAAVAVAEVSIGDHHHRRLAN